MKHSCHHKNECRAQIIEYYPSSRCEIAFSSGWFLRISAIPCYSQSLILDTAMHYLRNGGAKEWATFPTVINEKQLTLQFQSNGGDAPVTLRLRQYDVKQNWRIFINDNDIGALVVDERI